MKNAHVSKTLRIKNKVALITGAASGIGKAIAELLTKKGAYVIVSDIQDEKGNQVAKHIGNKASYQHLDVTQEKEWKKVFNAIKKKYRKLDILVNNAGITGISAELGPQDPEQASLESWHHVHAVNLDGVFLGCKYGIQLMKKRAGLSLICLLVQA